MLLKELFERYRNQLEQKYGLRLLPAQRRAIDDVINCRTPVLGEILSTCPHCGADHTRPHSCGNRNYPVCQNHLATAWLDKQRAKLLPVRYYLLTFTLPAQPGLSSPRPYRPARRRHRHLRKTVDFKFSQVPLPLSGT